MKKRILVLVFTTMIVQTVKPQYTAELLQLDSAKYSLEVLKDTCTISKRIPYPVFKFFQADIDNHGEDEMILGVIKKTYFDTITRKRINIWKIQGNAIVPMWLGSKLFHPLYDFEVVNIQGKWLFRTIENEFDGNYLIAEYEWHSFGLKFRRFIKREISLQEANIIIKSDHES